MYSMVNSDNVQVAALETNGVAKDNADKVREIAMKIAIVCLDWNVILMDGSEQIIALPVCAISIPLCYVEHENIAIEHYTLKFLITVCFRSKYQKFRMVWMGWLEWMFCSLWRCWYTIKEP